jgi:hypothetical protein
MLVGALEVPDEISLEIGPIMYGVGRQVLEPSPCPFHKMDMKELDDQVVVLDSHHAAHKSVVFKPHVGIRGAIVLGDVGWCAYLWERLCLLDIAPEGVWSHPRWARAAHASSFVWLVELFLFPTPVVEDLPSVADASDAMLYVDTC